VLLSAEAAQAAGPFALPVPSKREFVNLLNGKNTAGPDALLAYTVMGWPQHVQIHSEKDIDQRLAALVKAFLGSMNSSSQAYQQWMSHQVYLHSYSIDLYPASKAIFAICRYDFHRVIDDWWQVGLGDIEQHNREGLSLLLLSVKNGSINVVKRLLKLGAHVNSPSSAMRAKFPITEASKKSDTRMVQLLLDAGAVANQRDHWYDCLLAAAAADNVKATVAFLFHHGADINMIGGRYGSALVAAAAEADEEMVQSLLDRGARTDPPRGEYSCLLNAAAAGGKIKLVQQLLDRGADVNFSSGECGCPLGVAAYWGKEGVAQLLLDRGADVNFPGGKHGCPLGVVAFWGKEGVAQLLLNCGADVNLPGGKYGCPLGAAAFRGEERWHSCCSIAELMLISPAENMAVR
jgi:ankyrin repeat protein